MRKDQLPISPIQNERIVKQMVYTALTEFLTLL